MENRNYKRITVAAYIIAALALIGLSVFLILNVTKGNSFGCAVASISGLELSDPAPYDPSGIYQVDPDEIESIRLDWVAGSIRISAEDRDTIEIKETGSSKNESEALGYEVKNGELRIAYYREKKFFRFPSISIQGKSLTVLLPLDLAGNLKNISLDTASADIDVNGMTAELLDIDKASGEFRGYDLTLKRLDVDCVSGDCTLEGSIDEVKIDTVSGDVKLTLNNLFRLVDIDSVSGDYDLFILKDCDLGVSRDSVSGSITSAIGYREQGAQQIKINSVSGDVRIEVID
jgi:lia operon protein LiaG